MVLISVLWRNWFCFSNA